MDEQFRQNLTRRGTWIRGVYMVLFALCYSLAEIVLAAVVVYQFISSVIIGRVNERLLVFGRSLSMYAWQNWMFLTYNSDAKPYPFGAWPRESAPDDTNKTDSVEAAPRS